MAAPGWCLLALAALLCFSGAIYAAEQEIQDFEFTDSDNEVKVVVKRAAQEPVVEVESDDEDFLADDAGSGPEDDYNGSGEPPPTDMPPFSNRFYRIEVTVPNLTYESQLADRNSPVFRDAAQRFATALDNALAREPGDYLTTVIDFDPAANVGTLLTIDLNVQGKLSEADVKEIWDRLISGQLPLAGYQLSGEAFSLRLLATGARCPEYVGREPTQLYRKGDNRANFLLQNAFSCSGDIIAWEYYREVAQGSAFVGIWRLTANSDFTLLHRTELPPDNTGYIRVDLEFPVPVIRGDFIGIFYPRETRGNVISTTTQGDGLVLPNELYQNYIVDLYADTIVEDQAINIDNYQFTRDNSTFALRAVMDYPDVDIGPTVPSRPCDPNSEFDCGDECVEARYRCDAQQDCLNGNDEINCDQCTAGNFLCAREGRCIGGGQRCNGVEECEDGSDEVGCSTDSAPTRGPPTLEPCLEGRFRCGDGSCISRSYLCDRTPHCPDGDDESIDICPSNFNCAADEFTCRSGECIPRDSRCNTVEECMDGSDEEGCPRICNDNEFRCDDGSCIDAILRCDSRPDCPNSEDELDCTPSCDPATEFACEDGRQCIPLEDRCNNIFDCRDDSDERPELCGSITPTGPPPCPETSFRCVSSGLCIDRRRLCDGNRDCFDASDEDGCSTSQCGEDQFTCDDGSCIDADLECDGIEDCDDYSDENRCNIACGRQEFTCDNGRCLDRRTRCNGYDDCGDGSDEAGCPCSPDDFECTSGQCIPSQQRCDRRRDCLDGSDEENCPCQDGEFQCADGLCILNSFVCDGQGHCEDGSDEINCAPRCRPDEIVCGDGTCLDPRRRCDGWRDCNDGADEYQCPVAPISKCPETQFQCNTGNCIDLSGRCDGSRDCPDGSDELDCPCEDNEFDCGDGRCLATGYVCNGIPECTDGRDERNCPTTCRPNEYTCEDGQCVSGDARCNRRYECNDGSDERGCASVTSISISPQTMRKRVGTSASFICQAEGVPSASVQWSRRSGGAMPRQAVISGQRLTIPFLRPEDSGDYTCSVSTRAGPIETYARLSVEYVGPPTSAPDPDGPCRRDEAVCPNGQCIPRDYLCDGEEDCADGSDESQCSVALPCEPNEFRCDNGRCAVKIWRCDGDDDCLDGSDERDCPTREPGAPCRSDEFSCASGDQCIPLSYQCDEEQDCLDRSDELGCMPPSIRTPPVNEIIVEINNTFSIICEAVGVPTPLIVWRLNWGNIPTGPRVTVTNYQGRGVLTVTNAVPEDSGAYTCEALNNRGSIFAVPDATIIVRRTPGVCPAEQFNAEAVQTSDCVRCFCFGQTQTCLSSDLQYSQIALGNQVALVNLDSQEPAEQGFIQYIPVSREFQVTDFNRLLREGSYYWSLPRQFLTKRLNSYGGELTYEVYYEVDTFDDPTSDPDVIISGNGITLTHRSNANFRPRAPTKVTVDLIESQWERQVDQRRGGPISEYATREDMMLVLDNVTSIYIRATYDRRQSLIKLGNVLLTTGVERETGLGRAVYVEQCTCPAGYTGYSCEECAPGFYRVERGRFGRDCVACRCNDHSNECDPLSGICRNCRDNTAGPYCNECQPGYVGDPRNGQPCEPCPCPLTNPENQFSRTCILDANRQILCTACPVGYEGRQCERCADGYEGDPTIVGQRCVPRSDNYRCDDRGSTSSVLDPRTGTCNCKENVEGRYCNECRDDTFYLSPLFPKGCISCFCMGVTQRCQSSTLNRTQESLFFTRGTGDVTLVDQRREQTIDQGLIIDPASRELVFNNFRSLDPSVHYWSLPAQFLGEKITSYGGYLRFTLRYRPGRDNSPLPLTDALVEMVGNEVRLMYRPEEQPLPNQPVSFSVPMIEGRWIRMDDQRQADREHIMMALADLEYINIRAAFTVDTEEAAISSISLDIAEARNTGQERAYAVEQCVCPPGYKGLSCQDCVAGYTRAAAGLYLGLCEPCRCNGHSSECDPETGVCRNCRHNTYGDKCEFCARGYYGDARRGTPQDCQRCPCPLTESPNQFSPDCILDRGDVLCTSCPPGHTGRRCERCEPGYMGNPLQPGDYCKPMNATCDCDARGTLPNTLCDPDTQRCQCKNNAQGLRCASCKEGFFNLDRDNDAGCSKCFCMGITDQCRSANYYRSEIIPMLNEDGTHNFEWTTRRFSDLSKDGFSMNADRNEITLSGLELTHRDQQSIYVSLPPKFRGDKVTSYGGYLRFSLEYTSLPDGRPYTNVDLEIIGNNNMRVYHVFRPQPEPDRAYTYDIRLVESTFYDAMARDPLTREKFLTLLADIQAILIRATYTSSPLTFTLRDVRMEIAVPSATGLASTPEVESCTCPDGYTGLSCQQCAPGYLRVEDSGTALGRCARCNCNGHASSCDPQTGECRNCLHNTEGERCERCVRGYYGDPTAGTSSDCRLCPCPLTISSNQFSPSCFLDTDNIVTCDRCPQGYTGRDCGECAPGFVGNPTVPGGRCERDDGQRPEVVVSPVSITEPLGGYVSFTCQPRGRGPFTVSWSRLDGRPIALNRKEEGPGPDYRLTISSLQYSDSARYVCTVTNPYGTDRAYVQLQVEPPERPIRVRIDDPTSVQGRLGGEARFVCRAIQFGEDGNYVLSWSKEGGSIPNKAIESDGVIVIPNLTRDDEGSYICTGSDPNSVDRARASIVLGTFAEKPTVRIEPRYVEVDVGDRVEFRCLVSGSPEPTVVWTRDQDTPLPSYVFTDESGLFVIESVSSRDEASYFCKAENSEGMSSVRTVIYVRRAPEPIQVIVRPTNITTGVGQTERIQCYVQNGRSADVVTTWSKERGQLPADATTENGILTLYNIQPSYAGDYYCSATSRVDGSVLATAGIRVTVVGITYERPTAQIDPYEQTVGTGQTAELRCIVTGRPEPTIEWSLAGGQLTSNHRRSGNVLRILQATMEDRGMYLCEASNVAGSARSSAIVNVERRELPVIEISPDTSITVALGAPVTMMCRVVGGNPRPTISWERSFGAPITARTELSQENQLLQIRDVTTAEQGEYTCTATNEVGSVSATASLRVAGKPTIQISPSTRITAYIGDSLNVECVGIGSPTPTVYWRSETRRRADVLPEALDVPEGTARLNFQYVRQSDGGRYICVARNEMGETEETVDIRVVERGNQGGVSIAGPENLRVNVGQEVTLTCSTEGLVNPRIRWRRPNNKPLPAGHRVSNGVLYIPRVEADDGGEYICEATSQGVPGPVPPEHKASIFIIVTVTPRVIIYPTRISARPGDTVNLQCRPNVQGVVTIEWNRSDGSSMSPLAREAAGELEIPQVTQADAGRYRCVVRTDAGGVSEGFADITVVVPPTIRIDQRRLFANAGDTVEIRCEVRQGDPRPQLTWNREAGYALPPQHSIRDGVLILFDVQPTDSGYYECRAENSAGRAREVAQLTVRGQDESGPDSTNVQRVRVGEKVEFECVAAGSPAVFESWQRLTGDRVIEDLPTDAVISEGLLVLPQARLEHSGIYRCLMNAASSFIMTEVELIVEENALPPVISTQPDYTTASLGGPAELRCDHTSAQDPGARFIWDKIEGNLPDNHDITDEGYLYIPRVREEDEGEYECLRTGGTYGTAKIPVLLVVGALVPYFGQNPSSYMAFKPLQNVYVDLDVLLSFRPEATDGLLLYNGQYNRGTGDYVCFGLQNQYPEFRFDVGSGPAIITGSKPLNLSQWHTVHLVRNQGNGSMMVNDEPAYEGTAPGSFQGLDVAQPMFVGGVPDYEALPRSARFDRGFVGGVSEIKIMGVSVNLGEDALDIVGVTPYQVCQDTPCENQGACQPYNNKVGFICVCPKGFAGDRCQVLGDRCYTGACGPQGRCINNPGNAGFSCICPLGYRGEQCLEEIRITDPAFNKTSFVSYVSLPDGAQSVSVRMTFKLRSLDDGIILYNAQQQNGQKDFISLAVKDRYLEFRHDTGSGVNIVQSARPMQVDTWTTVLVEKTPQQSTLVINNEEPVYVWHDQGADLYPRTGRGDDSGTNDDDTVGLNTKRPLFLGGVDPQETINPNVGVYDGFVGCIGELMLKDTIISLSRDAQLSLNVQDCGDRSVCERRPCENGGTCVDYAPTRYRCDCGDSFMGDNCQIEVNICVREKPCLNGGTCVAIGDSFQCHCPLNWKGQSWTGDTCERAVSLETSVSFQGDGYAELPRDSFAHSSRNRRPDKVSITFRTTEENGLLLWHGHQEGKQSGKDYFSVAIVEGYVVFSYELGSGPAMLKSAGARVDDGRTHTVEVTRLGKDGTLRLDNEPVVTGSSQANLQMLNLYGNVFIGGVPDFDLFTAGLVSHNFNGCISQVSIMDGQAVNFKEDTVGGMNGDFCA